MKKILTVLLLILTGSALFALPLSFSLLGGYENQSFKDRDNASNSIGITVTGRTPINEYLDFYGLFTMHFGGNFKFADIEYSKALVGYKIHAGAIYNIPLRSETLKTGLGATLVFARSTAAQDAGDDKIAYGFSNIGIGLHAVGSYVLNEHIAVMADINPDIYFVNWNTVKQGNTTTSTKTNNIGFGFSIKAGVTYTL